MLFFLLSQRFHFQMNSDIVLVLGPMNVLFDAYEAVDIDPIGGTLSIFPLDTCLPGLQ